MSHSIRDADSGEGCASVEAEGVWEISVLSSQFCNQLRLFLKIKSIRDFPGGPVVKTSPSSAGGVGLIPSWGVKIPQASRPRKPNHKMEAILQQIQ